MSVQQMSKDIWLHTSSAATMSWPRVGKKRKKMLTELHKTKELF
jgi:hypothetical protein